MKISLTCKAVACIVLAFSIFHGCSERTALDQAREEADPRVARYLILAEDALHIGAYNSALVWADSAKAVAPDLADVHFMYGLIYNETMRQEEAETYFQEVVAFDPKYKGVWLNLGHVAYRAENYRRALRFYQREQENYPAAGIVYSIGRCYEKLGVPDSAMIAYDQALSLDDKYSLAYMRLGQIYMDAGDLDQALKYAQNGLALEPDNLDYQYSVGAMLMLKGNAEGAYPYFKRVVEERPWHYWAVYNLGQVLLRMDRKEEADIYVAKAETLSTTLREIEKWRGLVNNNPDQFGLWYNLGNTLRKAHQLDEAIEAYKMAIYIEPQHLEMHNDLANMFLMRGDTTAARSLYEEILRRKPDQPVVWLNLGVLHAQAGNFAEARSAWERVLEINPNDETAKQYLDEINK